MAASKDVVGRMHEYHVVWGWEASKSIFSARDKWDSRAIGWRIALKIVSGQFWRYLTVSFLARFVYECTWDAVLEITTCFIKGEPRVLE